MSERADEPVTTWPPTAEGYLEAYREAMTTRWIETFKRAAKWSTDKETGR